MPPPFGTARYRGGCDSVFSGALTEGGRERGSEKGRLGVIRLKFQRYLRRDIFSKPFYGLSGCRVAHDRANIRRLTRKSLVPVVCLSSSPKRKTGFYRANFDDDCARKCGPCEGREPIFAIEYAGATCEYRDVHISHRERYHAFFKNII